jgi:hypothetical protein
MTEYGLVPKVKQLIVDYLLDNPEGATLWELRTLMVLHRSVSKSLADMLSTALNLMVSDGAIRLSTQDRVTPRSNGRKVREAVYQLSFEKWVEAVA